MTATDWGYQLLTSFSSQWRRNIFIMFVNDKWNIVFSTNTNIGIYQLLLNFWINKNQLGTAFHSIPFLGFILSSDFYLSLSLRPLISGRWRERGEFRKSLFYYSSIFIYYTQQKLYSKAHASIMLFYSRSFQKHLCKKQSFTRKSSQGF